MFITDVYVEDGFVNVVLHDADNNYVGRNRYPDEGQPLPLLGPIDAVTETTGVFKRIAGWISGE